MSVSTGRVWIRAILAMVAASGFYLSFSYERRSVERANRMLHEGDTIGAAELYAARRLVDGSRELSYNLGTALIGVGTATGEQELGRARTSADPRVRARAEYNTGLSRLERALTADEADSVRTHAGLAVEANRAAIRLDPENDDAKWNLAMALRLLDLVEADRRRSGREMMDGAMEADVVTRSVNTPDPAEDEFVEDPPAEGEDETVAVAGDEGPLSPEEAAAILGRTHLDASGIVEKLLDHEARTRWGRRSASAVRRW